MAKYIELTQGQRTLVDDRDYDYLMQWKWFTHSNGYAVRNTYNKKTKLNAGVVYMHRQVLGVLPGFEVDHISGDKLDNRRRNLRVCTTSENQANRKASKGYSSKYKGVRFDTSRNRWRARIVVRGKEHYLGRFLTEEEAALAYDEAARQHFGQFSRTNFQ